MAPKTKIRLVSFDALFTIVRPRLPIHIQYSDTFAPYLGELNPDKVKSSFKAALKEVQLEQPAYKGNSGAEGFWSEVIRRAALGAGASSNDVDASLHEIVPRLLKRFSSREGYELFQDTLPVLLHLKNAGIRTALVSNTDTRMRLVLDDLGVLQYLDPVVLSEEAGVEKPAAAIFRSVYQGICAAEECLHIGDELRCDYHGAINADMQALLLRRPGPEGEGERKEPGENLSDIVVADGLWRVVEQASQ